MRRLLALALLAVTASALGATQASAHPLGNFTLNHLTQVSVSRDGVRLRYILDIAEIPTFQARRLSRAEVLRDARREVARRLVVTVDGRRVALRDAGPARLTSPAGQGGLDTTRIELLLQAQATGARSVRLRDGTYPDRLGYAALVARPGAGTAVRSSVSSEDPTRGLRTYPRSELKRPLQRRSAKLEVREGDATLVAPRLTGTDTVTTRSDAEDGFAGVFAAAASGKTALLALLLAALGWGALHALSPGHGKAMVAAYLVGARGTSRHAVVLGAVVTVTHTIGVFALGLVTLLLARYILPEDLFPWLTLISGLLVVAIGLAVLRSRVGQHRARRAHDDAHVHGHAHSHDHTVPDTITRRGLIAMGASAGLIPCPSALVVLLAAVAQHQVALGLVLILAFSVGLAATLTALGLLVVHAGRVTTRLRVPHALITGLPAASAVVIIGLGCVLALQAAPELL